MNARKESDRIARQLSKIHQRRIAKLKKKITTGKYHVSNIELAKALFMAS